MENKFQAQTKPMTAKIELAVDLSGSSESVDLKTYLKSNNAIQNVAVNTDKQTVVVETALPTHDVVRLIELSGAKALVTGIGAAGSHVVNLGSAVAIMHEGNPSSGVRGVTRIVQSTMDTCIIDGTVDGLNPNSEHRLAIHEYGDISDGCNSCGDVLQLQLSNSNKTLYGDLGSIFSDATGSSSFRMENNNVKVWDIIGRSVVIKSKLFPKAQSWTKLACGIVARSAGVFENFKRICACDGTTIWDERTKAQQASTTSSQL